MTPSLTVVIPVYNSQVILPELVERLGAVLPTLADDYELLLVNDGSADQSWQVVDRLAGQNSWIRGINLMRNYGQHNAVLCGIRAARGAVVVTMDDDLQHPPEEIHKLLARLDEGYDVVYGTPQKLQHGLWRNIASWVWRVGLQGAMGVETARNLDSFRVLRTRLREAFADYEGPFVLVDVLLTWGTTRFAHTPVGHAPRRAGVSNYTFRKLVVHTVNVVTAFSTVPLQIASFIGFAFTIVGMLLFIYVLAVYILAGGSVPGFPFLASIIAIFSGAQMFAFGILGAYLARMHYRLMKRPSYTIGAETGPGAMGTASADGSAQYRAEVAAGASTEAHEQRRAEVAAGRSVL